MLAAEEAQQDELYDAVFTDDEQDNGCSREQDLEEPADD